MIARALSVIYDHANLYFVLIFFAMNVILARGGSRILKSGCDCYSVHCHREPQKGGKMVGGKKGMTSHHL